MTPERLVPASRMDPVVLGMVLGLVNTLVIGAGMNAIGNAPGIAIAGSVFAYGFLPATFVGAMLGAQAHRTRDWPIWARRVILTTPAFVLVILLAGLFQFPDYALLSFLPTLAAALYLEQRTRETVLPAARTL